jgi:pSer/pThr/pTyr-binding forkhead associated (FHA) protein
MSQDTMISNGLFALQQVDSGQVIARIVVQPGVGYVLGRSDENSPYVPDIDLAGLDALAYGVSRRHAALVLFRGGLHVVDLHSVNGTYVNEQRLRPEEPHVLHANDQLRLGTLNLSLIKIQ